jgi:hypothetical protein
MLTELHTVHTRRWQNSFGEKGQPFAASMSKHDDIAQFLRGEGKPNRVAVNDRDIPVNFGDVYSINMMEGYTAGVTENLLHFGRHTAAAQRLYGITHYIGRQTDRADYEEIFAGENGMKVYRAPAALPRARSVHEVVTVESPGVIEPLLNQPQFDPGRTVILAGTAPALERCAGDHVAVTAYAPNRVRLRARMSCRGMVVLSDTYYPGWKAFVDGRETRIWEAYGSVRGVVVEAGSHEVDFRFRPVSVIGGMVLTAAGVLAAIGIALIQLRTGQVAAAPAPSRPVTERVTP